jgi:hypothetical protein
MCRTDGRIPRPLNLIVRPARMRLGYFPGFKGGDAVLVSCAPTDVATLRSLLRKASGTDAALPIHEHGAVTATSPVELVAARTGVVVAAADRRFTWRLDSTYSSVDGLLEGLQQATTGHQYFDLDRTSAFLMVSVGEYDENWWARRV